MPSLVLTFYDGQVLIMVSFFVCYVGPVWHNFSSQLQFTWSWSIIYFFSGVSRVAPQNRATRMELVVAAPQLHSTSKDPLPFNFLVY